MDDRTDDRAFGADDVAGAFHAGQRLRKLRFLMTGNKLIDLPGAGHYVFITREAEVIGGIREFLAA
jgi:pimeloyl-ACP methyl ester carboxylesterase